MNRRYPLMLIFLIALLAVSITATVLAVNASMPFLTAASLLFAISACIGLYRLHLRQYHHLHPEGGYPEPGGQAVRPDSRG